MSAMRSSPEGPVRDIEADYLPCIYRRPGPSSPPGSGNPGQPPGATRERGKATITAPDVLARTFR